MPTTFKGTAHPKPRRDGKRDHAADLSGAEISTTNLGRNGGTQLLVEHDHGHRAGRVLSSWEGPDGSMRVSGIITDSSAEQLVKSGAMRGLSLGTSVTSDAMGQFALRTHDELSICEEPRRAGCYIDSVDGRQVRAVHAFSKKEPMSSDAAATESSATVAETFSAEYVAELKKQLDAKSQAEAQLKAKFAVHESRQREQLKDMQPAVQAWIKEGLDAAGDYKHEVTPMAEFGDKLHEASNIDSAMPLARMISCHSAKIKREREEFSQGAATAEALGKANKELDELRADRDTKTSRIAELEGLVNERTVAAEKLQEELAKAGVLKDTFEFSKASARETAAPETTGGSTSSSSSAPAAPFVDPLLSLVMGRSGSGRIMPSTSSHSILGAVSGSDDISAAIRMA